MAAVILLFTALLARLALAGLPRAATASPPAGTSAVRIVPATLNTRTVTWNLGRPTNPPCSATLGPAILEANLWNVAAAVDGTACTSRTAHRGTTKGTIRWTYRKRTLTLQASLQNTDLLVPSASVAGYPEIIYGWSPFAGAASPQAPGLHLPLPLGRLPHLLLITNYQMCGACLARANVDVAYDLWLSRSLRPTWCGSCVPRSAVEVMIWLAHSRSVRPLGSPLGGATRLPAAWLQTNARWRRASISASTYVCPAGGPGCGTHTVVSFVLDGPHGQGLTQAHLALALRPLLDRAIADARTGRARKRAQSLYLNGIELGSEVGPGRNGRVRDHAPIHFTLSLRRYCVVAASSPGAHGRRC